MYNPSRRAFLVKVAVATGGILVGGSLAGCGSGSGAVAVAESTTSTFPHVTTGTRDWLGSWPAMPASSEVAPP